MTTIETVNCAACDSHHYDVELHQYKSPKVPATHWYICPTTNDPVDVAIVELQRNQNVVLGAEALAMLSQAMQAESWLLGVWYLTEGGKAIKFLRKANNFPISEFPIAVNQLRDDLRVNENVDFDPPQTMQKLDNVKPIVNLFGAQPPEEPAANTNDEPNS